MLSRKSQREMSVVKVVYQYNDVVLWQEPAQLMEFFERRASILNRSFLKLRSIVEFYYIQLMISICDRLLIAMNEKPLSISIKPLSITNSFLLNPTFLLPGVVTNQMKIRLSSQIISECFMNYIAL